MSNNWKCGNFKTLVRRAYDLCSSDYYFSCKIQHLVKVFHKQNDYPIWIINKVSKEFESKQNETTPIPATNEEPKNNLKKKLVNIIIQKVQYMLYVLCKSKIIVFFLMI